MCCSFIPTVRGFIAPRRLWVSGFHSDEAHCEGGRRTVEEKVGGVVGAEVEVEEGGGGGEGLNDGISRR